MAATAADLALSDALDAVDVALGAELIHEVGASPDQFRFSHQLVPTAVFETMSSSRRVRLHARIAEILETDGGSHIEVAHHLIEASPVLDTT